MFDGLLFPLVIDHREAGGFAPRPGRGGQGDERNAGIKAVLLQVIFRVVHPAIELDALSHIDGASPAHGKDSVAALPVEQLHPFAHILIQGVGPEIAEFYGFHVHGLDKVPDIQVPERAAADQQRLFYACAVQDLRQFFIGIKTAVSKLTHNYSSGIRVMMSLMGMQSCSSASFARWFSRISLAAFCMAGKPLRVSWFA